MSLGRVLVEEFQPEVLKWLRERVDLVVVNPWVEPQRWELEVVRADAVISRKGKITREQMERSAGRLKIIARALASESIRRASISKLLKNTAFGSPTSPAATQCRWRSWCSAK